MTRNVFAVTPAPRLPVWLPALVEGGAELTGDISRPISYDRVALLNMLSILSDIDGIGMRACLTGGGSRKNSVSKSPSFIKPC